MEKVYGKGGQDCFVGSEGCGKRRRAAFRLLSKEKAQYGHGNIMLVFRRRAIWFVFLKHHIFRSVMEPT